MTEADQSPVKPRPAAAPARPRRPRRGLAAIAAVLAAATILSGHDLVAGLSAPVRSVVVVGLLIAFGLLATAVTPWTRRVRVTAGYGFAVLAVAVSTAWLASGPGVGLQGPVEVTYGNNLRVCGELTSMDRDFATVAAKVPDASAGGDATVTRKMLIPTESVISVEESPTCR